MGTMSKRDGMWQLDIPVTQTGDISQTLNTSGTYVDANIKVNVQPQAGKAQVSAQTITANPTIGSTASSGKYPINVSGTATITPTTQTNGVIDNTTVHTGGTITVTGSSTVDESNISNPTTTEPASIDKTVSPDVNDRYITISAGYKPSDRHIKITGMTGSSGEYTVDAGSDVLKKPVIANKASSAISGKTQLDASITTSSSSVSTPYYMAVQSPANTGTVTATAEVTQAGYIATGSKTDTATVGASASDITYISIPGASENSTIANSTGVVTVGTASDGYYPLTNSMSSQIHTTTAGWTIAGDKTVESHSGVQVGKIAASTVSATGTVKTTPSVTITTTPTNVVTSGTDTGYAFTVSATNNAGAVTPKHSATAGYTPVITNVADADITVTPTNSGTGTTYIQAAVLKGEVTNNTAGSASMTATSVESAASGSHYITLSTTAGSVKAKASATTEGYVKNQTGESAAATVNVTGNGTKFYIKDAVTTQGTTTVSWTTLRSGDYKTEPGGSTSAGSYATGASITITEVKEGIDETSGLWGKVADNKWIVMSDVDDTVVRGTESITEGYITAQSLPAATFKNAATSGKTYVDLSATDDAPVLVANDYLYIDKGYTDYVKISLSKLVPEGASAGIAAGDILSGHSAYNSNGELIQGTIPNLLSTDVSAAISGTNYVITVPAQKYTTGSAITSVACAVYQGAYS